MTPSIRSGLLMSCAVVIAAAVGCGPSGPPTYHVSGTVTHEGEPVPLGSILFQPDTSKGNSGAYGSANIKDGKYDTRLDGQPASGGPQIVIIEAFDGVNVDPDLTPYGQSLAPVYQEPHDLPEADSTLDIELSERSSR